MYALWHAYHVVMHGVMQLLCSRLLLLRCPSQYEVPVPVMWVTGTEHLYPHNTYSGSLPCIAAYSIGDDRQWRLERQIAILYVCIATALMKQNQFVTVSSPPRYCWICTCLLCTLCMLRYVAAAAEARH